MIKVVTVLFLIAGITGIVSAGEQIDTTFSVHPVKSIRLNQNFADVRPFISVAATGDVMLSGGVEYFLKKRGVDYPFKNVNKILTSADIATCNLEAPFTINGAKFKKKFNFKIDPRYAVSIKNAGFDIVNLANNHILDYGKEGLVSTLAVLDSLRIEHTGAGLNREKAERPAVIKVNNKTVGFLSYSLTYPSEFWAEQKKCGTAYPSFNRVKKSIQSLKKECDFVIVQYHWGGELQTNPKSYQKWYAHASIDAGADAVIGHHPHVLQGIEIYKGRLIAYSLGNFVFGSYSRKVKESVILKIWFDKKGTLLSEVVPISVNNYKVMFCPVVQYNAEKLKTIETLNGISAGLNKGRKIICRSGLIRNF